MAESIRCRHLFLLGRPFEDADIDCFQRIIRGGGAAGLTIALWA